MTIWQKLRRGLRSFCSDRSGNVMITFTLATLPIVGFTGFAVDYSHANSVKAAMQAALDSTALMLSKEASTDTPEQLQTNAQRYFTALFNRPEATGVTVTASYISTGGSQLLFSGSANVPTSFLGVIGYRNITVRATSTAKWGTTRLRVALVLDNTGSMAQDGKMTALQTATKNLLSQLQNAAGVNGDVYVSIIPFVKDVNVDSTNYNADWIYWGTAAQDPTLSDDKSWDANNGTCSRSGSSFKTRSSCVAFPVCSRSRYTDQSSCVDNGGTWYTTAGVWTPKAHSTWNGCIMDRGDPGAPNSGNYDANVAAPDSTITATLYPAEQYGSCPQATMGLSYNWSSMTALVNAMTPAGNTNQAIGLQLGWMSLVGGGPFTVPAKDPNYTYNDIIILLTDGLNTQDRWYTSQSSIDARQQLTCNNVKAGNITLYTIQVNTGGDPTSSLLQNCATDSSKFFLLTTADQIVTTFNQIGTNLTKLRVAQ